MPQSHLTKTQKKTHTRKVEGSLAVCLGFLRGWERGSEERGASEQEIGFPSSDGAAPGGPESPRELSAPRPPSLEAKKGGVLGLFLGGLGLLRVFGV